MVDNPDIWDASKLEIFRDEFMDFLNCCEIHSKETGGHTILGENIFGSQTRLLNGVFSGLAEGIHDFKVLKSRQLGCSTFARAFALFWMGVHDGLSGACILDSDGNKEAARREIETMIENLPARLKFPKIKTQNRYGITLANGSKLLFMSAGQRKGRGGGTLGRSAGLNFVIASEMCLHPDTPVIVGDGKIKAIKDVAVEDRVVTHTGNEGRIVDVIARKNDKRMLRITPWLGEDIICTYDHKIVTQRGKVEAQHLAFDDKLVMPVRLIAEHRTHDTLPETKRGTRPGSISAGSGATIKFTEEFGFAIGYYLAEGSLTYQRRGEHYKENPSGIIFTRHRNEKAYADRAIAALHSLTTGKRTTKDNPRSLATTEHLYGSSFARWVNEKFGAGDEKRIPDEVFGWGSEFCGGLLAGLLCGDGSKGGGNTVGGKVNLVCLTTTRSSLATQARDLAASLGYGWASIRSRPAGNYYGRNCKASWTVVWNGSGGGGLRELMGLAPFKPKTERKWTQRYKDTAFSRAASETPFHAIEIKIRSVTEAEDCPVVYDITVDHEDHTFRTPSMSVSNCSWENQEGVVSLRASLSKMFPNRLYIWESTARGFNVWFDMWEEAKNDDLTQRAIFLGWWSRDDQRIKVGTPAFEKYGKEPPTDKELERIKAVKDQYGVDIDQEQLAWFRQTTDPNQTLEAGEQEDPTQRQEQPWTEEEAFVLTGSSFFSGDKLSEMIVKTSSPNWTGYKYYPGLDFFNTRIERAKSVRDVQLKVWEEPVHDATYIVTADPAFGHDETNNNSALHVLRCYADRVEQVAEFASPLMPTNHFAWVIASLCGWYGCGPDGNFNNIVHVIIELNGPGEAVWNEFKGLKTIVENPYYRKEAKERGLANVFQNVRNYLYSRSDSMGSGNNYHWKCLALDTPIPTETGWTTIGEIKVGDRLFDERGEPCDVIAVAPVQEGSPCLEVTFDDGSKLVADEEHLWELSDGRILRTEDLVEGDKISVAAPLLPETETKLPINPYTLGVWLGDGHSAAGRITAHKDDMPEMCLRLHYDGQELSSVSYPKGRNIANVTIVGLTKKLREAGILGKKRIPKQYLRASIGDRMELLRGLMDTDGSIDTARQCSFSTSSPELADDFSELIRSLGFKAKKIVRSKTLEYKGKEVVCADAHQFWFTAYPDTPIFRLKRKLERQRHEGTERRLRSKRHVITSIREVESVPVRCIEVNSPSHLYLAGDGMVPTHNTTGQLKEAIFERFRDFLNSEIVIIRSQALLEEMKGVIRDGSTIGAEGRNRDDRAFAMAMGLRCWEERARRQLMTAGKTKQRDEETRKVTAVDRFALFNRGQLDAFFQKKRMARIQSAANARYRGWRFR
jgi:intein/homing endonuclease